MSKIETVEALENLYGSPSKNSLIKEVDHIIPEYATFIEKSPFCLLATAGPEGLDCSPRGESPGFVAILDEKTLAMPDRKGNNRLDSIKNIVRDGRYSLCFLVPGSMTCMRVTGTAEISVDDTLIERFTIEDKPPKTVILFHVQTIYFQCGKSILRSNIWSMDAHTDPANLPTQGELIRAAAKEEIDAKAVDERWEKLLPETMW